MLTLFFAQFLHRLVLVDNLTMSFVYNKGRYEMGSADLSDHENLVHSDTL
ncbi:hypothetical protein GNIT_2065 [Glaciecola nitratireducens FR1064]|uniref:Uncharacterized protein n=1 Tax=Glaciecola nitratireducens (strain JCM 12485 / KCTC 12276 / FR1064) TaxID=1085623 RepID=G4QGY6_GLANF|nr:hypothetical protein GNIT_2065 [Glaciecola nitratireducens FR1064]